jgi:very-short-patch-repair endonuclease
MERINNLTELREHRKELRRNQTEAESIIWWYVRGKRIGPKFKRQHSISGYIVDFYCAEKKLILEIDGEIHNTTQAKESDLVRDKFFKDMGYQVLRFTNNEVEYNIHKVIDEIKSYF